MISAVTLATYVALVFGLPLPAAPRKAGEQPYPCQDSPCGCMSAEQCWKSCCCLTPEQRFAWAREHGVTPPEYAEQPQSSGWQSTPRREQDQSPPKKKSCCSESQSSKVKPAKSCCERGSCSETSDSEEPTEPAPEQNAPSNKEAKSKATSVRFVLGVAAMKCQGLASMFLEAGQAPVPPAWFAFQSFFKVQGWVILPSFRATAQASLPPLQPPRV